MPVAADACEIALKTAEGKHFFQQIRGRGLQRKTPDAPKIVDLPLSRFPIGSFQFIALGKLPNDPNAL